VNRSAQSLPGHIREAENAVKDVNALKARVKGNKPAAALSSFTGEYTNDVYGTISIKNTGDDLEIKFNGHNTLTASLQYMDNDEWLMVYNNPAFGIFGTKFKIEQGKIISVDIKANDFVEFDSYIFTKK